jgi:hypothetical protein
MNRSIVSSILLFAACGSQESPDRGLDLGLRVRGAQLVEGPLPSPAGGPAVTFVEVGTQRIYPGEVEKLVAGRTGKGSFAVRVWLEGDRAHWLVRSGVPDALVPDELTFSLRLDFASHLANNEAVVKLQAGDAEGKPGETKELRFAITPDVPQGPLVISLSWDRQVDLDLHVVGPDGVDLNAKNINAYEPPGPGKPPAPPDAWMSGAILDFDSNAGCVIDGRRVERAIWSNAPASGHYSVYADLFSTCGESGVRFRAEAFRDGQSVASAIGSLYEIDARTHPLPPGSAPGLLVLELDL